MRCLTPAQRALAASRDDDEPHLADCVACRAAVAEQRAIRALVRRAPAPPLPRSRREAIAAEVMAQPYAASAARTPIARGTIAVAVLAAAAAVVVIVRWPAGPMPSVPGVELAATEPVAEPVSLAVRGVSAEVAPARPVVPATIAVADSAADFTRVVVADHEVVELRDGALTIDARNARDVKVTVHGTTVRVARAKVRVVARAGVIETVAVFAGSAEVMAAGKLAVVEAGMVWEPDAVGPATALHEFRTGWSALRAGDLRAAIAAFDRARDPVVAEDAAYWAAVAAERAGDRGDAWRRFTRFLDRFPGSPHADSARVALVRLAR